MSCFVFLFLLSHHHHAFQCPLPFLITMFFFLKPKQQPSFRSCVPRPILHCAWLSLYKRAMKAESRLLTVPPGLSLSNLVSPALLDSVQETSAQTAAGLHSHSQSLAWATCRATFSKGQCGEAEENQEWVCHLRPRGFQ